MPALKKPAAATKVAAQPLKRPAAAPSAVAERPRKARKAKAAAEPTPVIPHDVGGQTALLGQKVPHRSLPEDHTLAAWELDIDALQNVFEDRPADDSRGWPGGVHAFRKRIESLDAPAYEALSYYERWAVAITQLCLESGLISQHDLDTAFGPPETTEPEKFRVGDLVEVKAADTATRWHKPHLRTPGFIFGCRGEIVSAEGLQENPEVSAYGRSGAKQPLYRVKFPSWELWNVEGEGECKDSVIVEVFQHWLKDATEVPKGMKSFGRFLKGRLQSNHDGGHGDGHGHGHGSSEEHGHEHEERGQVEQKAVDKEGPPKPAQRLAESLVKICLAKGLATRKELQDMRDLRDGYSTSDLGARIVAKAWKDSRFRDQVLKDANKAIKEAFGVDVPVKLVVVQNTAMQHNIVVCTLCSCYPTRILGRPPAWYKSREYRARVVIEPRKVLEEFNVKLLHDGQKVVVHDSTSDLRYMVIPLQNVDVGLKTEEELVPLIHRDHMVGMR